jgi:hypothetical protein
VGAEQSSIVIRFDYASTSTTTTSASVQGGKYSSYRATTYFAYANWLDSGDRTLFHEYGHAWSQYYYYMVQEDPTLTGYLQARGLYGDARVGSTYAWSPDEMIAEDYRQLFGTPNAQTGGQLNTDIPPASQVAGLRDYLSTTFLQSPGVSASPASAAALAVTNLSVNPTPVVKSGSVSFSLSATASVSVSIQDSQGRTIRTLLSNTSGAAGSVTVSWDRRDSSGRRAKTGKYAAFVSATDSAGNTVTASQPFTVN